MAIGNKLKVTRDQLAEFIESHNTIRQFERLFEYINTFVIPDPEVNNSNCFIEKYDTGWVANSDWTDMDENVPHTLSEALPGLEVKLLISVTGSDSDSFIVNPMGWNTGLTAGDYGYIFYNVDDDNIRLQSGFTGIAYLSTGGYQSTLTNQAYYYKVVVTKLTILEEET